LLDGTDLIGGDQRLLAAVGDGYGDDAEAQVVIAAVRDHLRPWAVGLSHEEGGTVAGPRQGAKTSLRVIEELTNWRTVQRDDEHVIVSSRVRKLDGAAGEAASSRDG